MSRVHLRRHAAAAVTAALIVITASCADGARLDPASTPLPALTATRVPTTGQATAALATPTHTAIVPVDTRIPAGFPLEPDALADLVVGEVGSRRIEAGAGGVVREVSASRQLVADPAAANAAGWNCAVHLEYEGMPAVDWYVQRGTPVLATMDGTATLYLNTYANAFDYYSVDREAYIGNPDRARAPVSPFPGPGGGMGVYVSVVNDAYRADYGHLMLDETVAVVPDAAFVDGFSAAYDYRLDHGTPRPFDVADAIAAWPVRRGDVIGYTGDAGYSEAPHLHYQIRRLADGHMLCPTEERGFADGGWLFR